MCRHLGSISNQACAKALRQEVCRCVQMRSEQWKQSGGDTGPSGAFIQSREVTNKVPGEIQVLGSGWKQEARGRRPSWWGQRRLRPSARGVAEARGKEARRGQTLAAVEMERQISWWLGQAGEGDWAEDAKQLSGKVASRAEARGASGTVGRWWALGVCWTAKQRCLVSSRQSGPGLHRSQRGNEI